MASLRLLPLFLALSLAGCEGGLRRDFSPAQAHRWYFELSPNAYLVSVADVAEIRDRVRTQGYSDAQIIRMEVVDSDQVWVRRGRPFGGTAELWRRSRGKWRRATPDGFPQGTTIVWKRASTWE